MTSGKRRACSELVVALVFFAGLLGAEAAHGDEIDNAAIRLLENPAAVMNPDETVEMAAAIHVEVPLRRTSDSYSDSYSYSYSYYSAPYSYSYSYSYYSAPTSVGPGPDAASAAAAAPERFHYDSDFASAPTLPPTSPLPPVGGHHPPSDFASATASYSYSWASTAAASQARIIYSSEAADAKMPDASAAAKGAATPRAGRCSTGLVNFVIVTTQRSGSHFVVQMLGSHPKAIIGNELLAGVPSSSKKASIIEKYFARKKKDVRGFKAVGQTQWDGAAPAFALHNAKVTLE